MIFKTSFWKQLIKQTIKTMQQIKDNVKHNLALAKSFRQIKRDEQLFLEGNLQVYFFNYFRNPRQLDLADDYFFYFYITRSENTKYFRSYFRNKRCLDMTVKNFTNSADGYGNVEVIYFMIRDMKFEDKDHLSYIKSVLLEKYDYTENELVHNSKL